MKKIFFIFFIFLILIVLFLSCAVGEYSGLIKVENKTSTAIKNVKIGDSIIVYQVNPGDTYNYWYYDTIEGKLSVDGLDVFEGQKDEEFTLEINYWVYITASRYPNGPDFSEPLLVLTKEKQGK